MSQSFVTNGNVTPCRFVKLDTTKTGGYCLQAGSGDRPIGVAQPGTRQPPMAGLDDGFAGVAGVNEIIVFTETDVCAVEIAASVTAGDYLKPDTNGRAVTASSDGDQYGAIALQSGTALGQLVRCKIATGFRGA